MYIDSSQIVLEHDMLSLELWCWCSVTWSWIAGVAWGGGGGGRGGVERKVEILSLTTFTNLEYIILLFDDLYHR